MGLGQQLLEELRDLAAKRENSLWAAAEAQSVWSEYKNANMVAIRAHLELGRANAAQEAREKGVLSGRNAVERGDQLLIWLSEHEQVRLAEELLEKGVETLARLEGDMLQGQATAKAEGSALRAAIAGAYLLAAMLGAGELEEYKEVPF